jgi:hypothetical protein
MQLSMTICINRKEVSKYIIRIVKQVLLLAIICSCEKEIPINFPDYSSQLVVEGWIEQGKGPKVLLTFSAPFFAPIDSSNIRNYTALRAKITLSNGSDSTILTLKPNDVYFPPYYYFSSELVGELNSEYQLKVEYSGKDYTAKTTIPDLVSPDSIWYQKDPGQDSLGLLWMKISDDPLRDNYYRTLVRRLGKDKNFVPTFISVFDDKTFNGQTLTLSLSKGSGNLLDMSSNRFFKIGDTLVLKFCSIDKPSYDFWHSLQTNIVTSANPFSANMTEIASNINNGLGIWCGYAAVYDTVIAK